jgi:hypothetical protein
MSGLLSVIEGNPRRGRRRNRRKSHRAKARRRRHRVHRASNPVTHRRHRRNRRHRSRSNPRHHRRHRNPLTGGVMGTLIKGATIGLGAAAANAATNAVNHFGFNGTMSGPTKLALKAGVGVGGWFVLKKLNQSTFANAFLIGAGVAVALDVYEQFVKPALVTSAPWLADYEYGQLGAYRGGSLQGWAPQQGLSGWAPQSGLSGDGDAYAEGAYS